MLIVASCLVAHWVLSCFIQSFFLHRYATHRMFTMSPFWERFFYGLTFVVLGPSFLLPRAYAAMHREHHAFSDTPRDPHSPLFHRTFFAFLRATKHAYDDYAYDRAKPETRFAGAPTWSAVDWLSQRYAVRLGFVSLYGAFYLALVGPWALLAVPLHCFMGPLPAAVVNWCGRKFGYSTFDNDDHSKNCLAVDFLTMGELLQNNHHMFSTSPNFAVRDNELDPTYRIIQLLARLGIVALPDYRSNSGSLRIPA